jgi:hypothetical protein
MAKRLGNNSDGATIALVFRDSRGGLVSTLKLLPPAHLSADIADEQIALASPEAEHLGPKLSRDMRPGPSAQPHRLLRRRGGPPLPKWSNNQITCWGDKASTTNAKRTRSPPTKRREGFKKMAVGYRYSTYVNRPWLDARRSELTPLEITQTGDYA